MRPDETPEDGSFGIADLGELEAPALPFAALAEHLRHRRDGGAETVAADVEIALHRRPAIHRRALRGAEATDRDVVARKSSTIDDRSEEHTSELQSLMRISYAVFCLKKKK